MGTAIKVKLSVPAGYPPLAAGRGLTNTRGPDKEKNGEKADYFHIATENQKYCQIPRITNTILTGHDIIFNPDIDIYLKNIHKSIINQLNRSFFYNFTGLP